MQGCLAAFFAKEGVTWVCPKEAKARSGADGGERQGLEMSSPSMDVSTPMTANKLKRRRCAAA